MDISGIGSTTVSNNSGVGSASANTENFLRLLVTQLQNQNPMNPLEGHEFMAQLAQFTSVEQLINLNNSFQEMFEFQQLLGGSELIGKAVTYIDTDTGENALGVVQGAMPNGGSAMVVIENREIPLSYITGIYQYL
ncbi:MAG: flagellar hook capping FlgD N-terminal domain-containing protein [Candidatus Loosdrechtia sp.]|uniref:flagellar hook capping FlgD N-terminal domain-containing protein n=1 Tax=Candidatus Loosdrechtia sp. TaxID=3101272 RepID=UPI003A701FFD|nr:MAG: flagellar hook capping FlgD N-terminal domain-containing protein [Candidatus Jettenia sp. AMX2]